MADVLAFRLGRCGLGAAPPASMAAALAVPAQDFVRDSVPLALLARMDDVTGYDAAVDAGDVVVAHVVRGAIHGCAPADRWRLGGALVSGDEGELGRQLGRQVQEQVAATGIGATDQLAQVSAAVRDALDGPPLDRVALHAALRDRVPEALLPWCTGCRSHHVAPMLWRYATVAAGARLDSRRRYRLDGAGVANGDAATRADGPGAVRGHGARGGGAARAGLAGGSDAAAEALRTFLRAYGPADAKAFAEWAGVAPAHARRLWDAVAPDLAAVDGGHVLAEDAAVLADPPPVVQGVRLLPPGDPALARPNRERLAPDAALRERLFRPVASPGAVLRDGRLAGLWRARARGRRLGVTVEPLGRLSRGPVVEQAERIGVLRGATAVDVTLT